VRARARVLGDASCVYCHVMVDMVVISVVITTIFFCFFFTIINIIIVIICVFRSEAQPFEQGVGAGRGGAAGGRGAAAAGRGTGKHGRATGTRKGQANVMDEVSFLCAPPGWSGGRDRLSSTGRVAHTGMGVPP
jgi:hypothetical protein